MKKLKLALTSKAMLTKEEMKMITGGNTYTCYCHCNSGLGTQPIYTTTSGPPQGWGTWYHTNQENCQCSTSYIAEHPGFNGGTCYLNYYI